MVHRGAIFPLDLDTTHSEFNKASTDHRIDAAPTRTSRVNCPREIITALIQPATPTTLGARLPTPSSPRFDDSR